MLRINKTFQVNAEYDKLSCLRIFISYIQTVLPEKNILQVSSIFVFDDSGLNCIFFLVLHHAIEKQEVRGRGSEEKHVPL